MAACGAPAGLPALHLSACARTCVQCNSAPCDMRGWEPAALGRPSVVLSPLGPERLRGVTSRHAPRPGRGHPFKMARAPSARSGTEGPEPPKVEPS